MREGLIPTLIGTGVTATGIALKARSKNRNMNMTNNFMPMITAGIIGFGLAHVLLGSIDLFEDR